MVQDPGTGAEKVAYEPPAIERVGHLGELTLGGGATSSDGITSASFT